MGETLAVRIANTRRFGTRMRASETLLLVLTLLSGAILGGCTGVVSASKSTDPTSTFQLNPATVNFGSVIVGKQGSQTVTVSNNGTGSVTIMQATVSNSQFSVSGVNLPMTMASGQTGSFTVAVKPTATGTLNGTLTVQGDGGSGAEVVNLTANAIASNPQISVSSNSVSFGNVGVGSAGTSNLTISNTGNADLTVSAVTVAGTGFGVSGITTPKVITAGQSSAITLSFSPIATGAATGSLSISSSDPTTPKFTVTLSGTGVQSGLTVNPASFNFGSLTDGQTKSQTFTVRNSGTSGLTISQLSVSGAGYTVNGLTTPANVAAGNSVTFNAVFAPTTAGSLPGTVNITSNAPNSPTTVALSGTGVAATQTLSFSSANIGFGNVSTGTSSTRTETITNTGNSNVQISQISVTGTGYSLTGANAPVTLTPSQTLTFSVVFAPTSAGSSSGSVNVTSNATGSPATISLTGSGVQPGLSVSPTSFNYGSVVNGQTKSQSFTITNSGTAGLTVSQLSISGAGYTVNGLSIPANVAAGGSVTFNAVFAPTTAGSLPGTVTITSNAPNSPATVALSGTGVAGTQTVSFSSTSIAFGNVNTGTSSTRTETVTNTGNSNVQISQISVSGTGFTLSGANTPVTLTPSQALTFSVIFNPTSAGSASGSVQVTSNATGSPATISLSGSGVQVATHTVGLTWNASTSSVSGYNVYRSTSSGTNYVKINPSLLPGTSYTDSTVQNGTTYYYVTTAVDSTGDESTYSNEATAAIP